MQVSVRTVSYKLVNLTVADVVVLNHAITFNQPIFGIKYLRAQYGETGSCYEHANGSHFGLKEAKDLFDAYRETKEPAAFRQAA